jgi:hypothetical protein
MQTGKFPNGFRGGSKYFNRSRTLVTNETRHSHLAGRMLWRAVFNSRMQDLRAVVDEKLAKNRSHLEAMLGAISSGEAVGFVGAGLSASLKYPSWRALLDKLHERANQIAPFIPSDSANSNVLEYAEQIRNHFISNNALDEFRVILGREFALRQNGENCSPTHRRLIKLPLRTLVTTNYDCCLESALDDKAFEEKRPPPPDPSIVIKKNRRDSHRVSLFLRSIVEHNDDPHMLPFVSKVTALPEYSDLTNFWKYKNLSCETDPIELIINTCSTGTFDFKKVAMLKELGRAAYANPLYDEALTKDFGLEFDREYRRRAIHVAEGEVASGDGSDVRNCPVCGLKSLVVYDETEFDALETTGFSRALRYTYQVKCMCCTFEINYHLDNPSKYGLKIDDYWQSKEV